MRTALILAAGLAVGFGAGRVTAAPPRPGDAALRQRLALAEARLKAQAEQQRGRAQEQAKLAAQAAGWRPQDPGTAEIAEAASAERTLINARELVAALEGMLRDRSLYRQDVLDFVQERLLRELTDNPAALPWVLQRFREAAGTELGEMLAVTLGQLKDASVEALALDLARSGTPVQRLAGLDLLDRLDIENSPSRQAVRQMLRAESDPKVLAAALYALHRGLPDPEETRDTLAALAPLTRHADVEVRRRAVLATAEWAADPAALDPVMSALTDRSADVRAAAAFALGQTRLLPPGLADALAARLSDPHEDWAVREMAWRTLSRLPLDERTYAAVAEFRRLREQAGEFADTDPHDHAHDE